MSYCVTKSKENQSNEDSVLVRDDMIAISDGAGGVGVFADEWSKYLVEKIAERNKEDLIATFEQFDAWIGEIWENFYNEHEKKALTEDGNFQHKFYQEGSFATLVVAWKMNETACHWLTYGDSVVFHYSKSKGALEHSFSSLKDFSNLPFLISCKDVLIKDGFRSGDFELQEDSVVFAASDALSHYILMMYYVARKEDFESEIQEILTRGDEETKFLSVALNEKDFSFDDLIQKLQSVAFDEKVFGEFVKDLREKNLLGTDDYTLAILDDKQCNIHS